MKIACVYPDALNWPKMRWVLEAFQRLGHTVCQVKDRDELQAADNECDLIVFAHKGLAIRWPNMRDIALTRKALWCQWWFDLNALDHRLHFGEQDIQKLLGMDIVFVKERSLLNEYHTLGINAVYLDQGCPQDMPYAEPQEREWDVLLWGQGGANYRQRTKDAVKLAKAWLKVAWAGFPNVAIPNIPNNPIQRLPWTHPDKLPELASKARCVLSVGRRNNLDGYWSDAYWLACGMGAVVLRRDTPGIPVGPAVALYSNNPVEAYHAAIELDGKENRKWVMENHTIEHRCRDLISIVHEAVRDAKVLAC